MLTSEAAAVRLVFGLKYLTGRCPNNRPSPKKVYSESEELANCGGAEPNARQNSKACSGGVWDDAL